MGTLLVLTKYQALGNDYLLLDGGSGDLEPLRRLVPRLCDRHLGVGADGILVFEAGSRDGGGAGGRSATGGGGGDPGGTMEVRIFNPDGSEAEKSGNGLRIAACHAVLAHGLDGTFRLRTRDRINDVRVLARDGGRVVSEIDIGRPSFEPDDWVLLDTPAGTVRCRLVNVGNPHCVVFGEPVTPERCRQLGPLLERHPRFPERTNVQLVESRDRGHARIEVWERGAGYTLASGTSASAVAAALIRLDLADRSLQVLMAGGALAVRQQEDGRLLQSGPAARVFVAQVVPEDLR